MEQRQLRIGLSLLFVVALSACTAGSSAAPVETSNVQVPAAMSYASRAVAASNSSLAIAIDSGSTVVYNNWLADTDFSVAGRSGVTTISRPINSSRVTDPAPLAVYQVQRYATHLTYAISGLAPAANYNVRLHLVESYFTSAHKRLFNITINGLIALKNLDIFTSAGGADVALVEQFAISADAAGKITIVLDASVNNASVAGIQVITATPTPTPTPTVSSGISAAPRGAFNPDPTTVNLCTDPCSPVIDVDSSTYNGTFFGSAPSLGHLTPPNPSVPLAAQDAYEAIAVYRSTSSDPSYTIMPTTGGRLFNTSAKQVSSLTNVHIPSGAMVDHSGEDWLIDIIDTTTGTEYNGYHFNTGSASSSVGRNNPIAGGGTLYALAVDSVTESCYGGNVNRCYGGSAGRIPQSLSELDPVEWLQGSITNSLHLVGGCETGTSWVFPAGAGGQGGGPSTCPPAGEILWLGKTDAQIEAMAQPRWVKTLYHNLHHYGWIPQDGSGASGAHAGAGAIQIDSDYTWTALGKPSQWLAMMNEMKAEGSGSIIKPGGSGAYSITIPVDSSISNSDLHWLQLLQQPIL